MSEKKETFQLQNGYEEVLFNQLQYLNCSLSVCQQAVLDYRSATMSDKTVEKQPKTSLRHYLHRELLELGELDSLTGKFSIDKDVYNALLTIAKERQRLAHKQEGRLDSSCQQSKYDNLYKVSPIVL